ncbi:MAG TPA: HD domain-containing phosphohydrolase [Candidatus Bathyarchaeia archaeon]|nr:HD domain-containing phosphohydrolase [Candidatus Bathyarchaeia archaeon]
MASRRKIEPSAARARHRQRKITSAGRVNGLSAAQAARELEELNRIGIALSATRDVDHLLALILQKAREITSADAGSLYLLEQPRPSGEQTSVETAASHHENTRRLRFRLSQNDSVQFPYTEHTLPITEASMAGYCALHGEVIDLPDAYRIPKSRPFHFNSSFDEQAGYRTRSLITLPMKNAKGEVLGVLQLINCKRQPKAVLVDAAAVQRFVHKFPKRAVRLALSLASQAAVAYENSQLYRDIENLFDGFVGAAVKAIEQRDPTTSGHSQRVCQMTLALAEAVDREPQGPYAELHFSRDQMKELRYAALLHDFGKVGVREEVLVKAKKLYPLQFARLLDRFDYIHRDAQARFAEEKVEVLLRTPRKKAEERLKAIDAEANRLFGDLDRYADFVSRVNEPTILPLTEFELLNEISQKSYRDPRGTERPYLTSEEVRFLSIPRGSLDSNERQQIESHVVHSFNFLAQIPWTPEYRSIPSIARAHHEKLNGQGYPNRLSGPEIPVQAKMMTICDIFDALAASDRPYKKAVPAGRALDILKLCVRDQEIDTELFRLFVEAQVYRQPAKLV